MCITVWISVKDIFEMEQSIEQLWQNVLELLKARFSEVTYQTTILAITPAYIRDNKFIIQTKNSFLKETIEARYLPHIIDAVKTVTNTNYIVEVVTPEDAVQAKQQNNSNLVNKYTFDSFVKANSNQLAHAMAIAVAQSPGTTIYNPLFLYGGVGLCKTHLMHSIGNFIKEQSPDTRVLYCSTETFMNDLITGIHQNKTQEFRDKYRECDVLLVDDIQFLTDRERTQEEFFHTFNILRDANKQIVISSDKPPKELKTLEDRLTSRFGQGIIVDLKLPDFETRLAILEKKAQIDNISIPKEVIMFIADNFYSNIRDLEGALNKVIAFSKLLTQPVTLALAQDSLKDMLTEKNKQVVDVPSIQLVVSTHYGITPDEMKSKKRTKNIAYSRQIAMYMSRKLLDISLADIGKHFGGKDHSTVIHGCEKIAAEIEKDEVLRDTINEIEKEILGTTE